MIPLNGVVASKMKKFQISQMKGSVHHIIIPNPESTNFYCHFLSFFISFENFQLLEEEEKNWWIQNSEFGVDM